MEIIREGVFGELLALCGGCCSCGTCHVLIDPEHLSGLPAISADEEELLDASHHRLGNSRLSCELLVDHLPDGLRIQIAAED